MTRQMCVQTRRMQVLNQWSCQAYDDVGDEPIVIGLYAKCSTKSE